jgi:hypothetical protein
LAGRPESFTGAVGQYDFKVEISATELSTDESLSLKIKLEGKGNVKFAGLPEPELPKAFEVFDPELSERIDIGSYGMRGEKEAEYLLVPRYAGEYKIGPLEFSFFNPQNGRYETIRTPVFNVKVEGGQLSPSQNPGTTSKEGEAVEVLNTDIHFIKIQPGDFKQVGYRFWNSPAYWIWFALALLSCLGVLLIYQIQKMRGRNPNLRRQQKAVKMARKRLAKAQKALKENDQALFYQEINAALWGYFGDKLNIGTSKMNKDNLSEELRKRQVEEVLIEEVIKRMNTAEMARFTKVGAGQPELDYQNTVELISEIEKQL